MKKNNLQKYFTQLFLVITWKVLLNFKLKALVFNSLEIIAFLQISMPENNKVLLQRTSNKTIMVYEFLILEEEKKCFDQVLWT